MGSKIYVGNLPWSVDKGKLEDLFSPFGEISEATVISDKYSGRSKGFGFVTFADEAFCSSSRIRRSNWMWNASGQNRIDGGTDCPFSPIEKVFAAKWHGANAPRRAHIRRSHIACTSPSEDQVRRESLCEESVQHLNSNRHTLIRQISVELGDAANTLTNIKTLSWPRLKKLAIEHR